jgi:ureidoglycolate hydrolase
MKKYFTLLILTLLIAVASCKKEDLATEQTFVEQSHQTTDTSVPSWMGNGNMVLTLLPDNKVNFLPGGDIIYGGSYAAGFNTITVIVEGKTYKFDVISKTELRYEKNRVLLLKP